MATQTPNYNLTKPDPNTDYYNIEVHNDNADKIDTALKDLDDKIEDLNAEDVGAETPTGAQAKADAVMQTHEDDPNPHDQYALDTELAALQNEVGEHKADYVRQPGYGTTGGSANTYTLTLNPALSTYTAGVCVAVKIHAANTGASTININGLGAKAIKKANGSALGSGNLKLNGVYTLRYDGTSFILQGEGGEYGNVTAADVRSGVTFGTEDGLQTGTLIVGKKFASGTATRGGSALIATEENGSTASPMYPVSVSGLSFTPSVVILRSTDNTGSTAQLVVATTNTPTNSDGYKNNIAVIGTISTKLGFRFNDNFYISGNSFILPVWNTNNSFTWEAYE